MRNQIRNIIGILSIIIIIVMYAIKQTPNSANISNIDNLSLILTSIMVTVVKVGILYGMILIVKKILNKFK